MAEHLAHGVVAINELLQAVAFDIQIEPDDTAGRRGRAICEPGKSQGLDGAQPGQLASKPDASSGDGDA